MSIFKSASIMPITRSVVSQGIEDGWSQAQLDALGYTPQEAQKEHETQSENHIREKKMIEDIEWYLYHQNVSPEIIQEVVYRIRFRFAN